MSVTPRGALPTDVTSFVGRVRSLAALAQLFADGARLVTLVGAGGIGKTRLAVRFARQSHPGAAWFCDLVDARSESDVVAAVVEALAVQLDPGASDGDAVTQVDHWMAAHPDALVVLDNFEHLVEHAPATVGRWLAAAPRARLLVTSREPLRLAGETVFAVDPLRVPEGAHDAWESEAVQLLLDRIRAAAGGAAPRASDAALLADVVRRLDGLPLGIELAAARAATVGMAPLRELLARPLEVLTRGSRDAAARHRTLRDAIAWSWDMLPPSAQDAMAACAVFRGGFTVDALAAVLGLGDAAAGVTAALDLAATLCERSLLTSSAQGGLASERRCAMLAGVADFARERLAADPARSGAAEGRHAAHYARLAVACVQAYESGADLGEARARLAVERENLAAVVERALGPDASVAPAHAADALVGLYTLSRAADSASTVLATFRAAERGGLLARAEGPRRVDLRVALGDLLRRQREFAPAAAALDEALALAREREARVQAAGALAVLGHTASDAGRADEAARLLGEAVEPLRGGPDTLRYGVAVLMLGESLREAGDPDAAQAWLHRAVQVFERRGEARFCAIALASLGQVAAERGEHATARPYLERAVAEHRAAGRTRMGAHALLRLGLLELSEARLAHAEARVGEALALLRAASDEALEGLCRGYLGIVWAEQGRLAEAVEALEAASHRPVAVPYQGLFAAHLGAARAALGDLAAARAAFDEAGARTADTRDGPAAEAIALLRGHLELADATRALAEGDRDAAARLLARARDRVARLDAAERDGATSPLDRSVDLRVAHRSIARALAAMGLGADRTTATAPDLLRVHVAGRWFQRCPGPRVGLRDRKTLQRLLASLAARRAAAPGSRLTSAELLAAGWPNTRMSPESALNRLRVSMSMLRKLGLPGLLSADTGYLLDPNVPLQIVRDEPDDAADG